jgi:hypothetical protein
MLRNSVPMTCAGGHAVLALMRRCGLAAAAIVVVVGAEDDDDFIGSLFVCGHHFVRSS